MNRQEQTLAVVLPTATLKKLKLFCVKNDITIKRCLNDLITNHLTKVNTTNED